VNFYRISPTTVKTLATTDNRYVPLLLTYFTLAKIVVVMQRNIKNMTFNPTECVHIHKPPQTIIYLAAYSVDIHVHMVGYITEPLT